MNININEVNEYDDINVKRNGNDIEIKVSGKHIDFNIYDEKTVYKKNVTKVNEEREFYSKTEYDALLYSLNNVSKQFETSKVENKKNILKLEEEYCLKLNEQNRDIENLKAQLKKETYNRNERELFNKIKVVNDTRPKADEYNVHVE